MYDLQLIEERIMSIANKMELSKNKLLMNAHLGKSFFDNMKKGRVPSVDKIHIIADYLNVSVDYLLGRTDIENSNITVPNSPSIPTLELNENESELLRIYRSLSVRSKNELMTAAYDIEDKKSPI